MQITRPNSRRTMAWRIVVVLVAGLTILGMGVVALAGLSAGTSPGVLVYVLTVAVLAAAYTVAPLVKDDYPILVVWPGVMLALAGIALWIVADFLGPPRHVILDFAIAFFLVLATIVLVRSTLVTMGRDAVSLIHPLLLRSMKGTRSTSDEPVPITLPLEPSKFGAWTQLGRFLRKERLADFVVVSRRQVTIRIGRVTGLGRFMALVLLPFGATVLRADWRGPVKISVDVHTYRLLERPGPYEEYCRNLVGSLDEMATLISLGELAEAKQVAVTHVLS